MITNYLTDQEEEKKEQIEEQKNEEIVKEPIKEEIKEENEQIEFTEEKSNNDNGEQSIDTIENQEETKVQIGETSELENNKEDLNKLNDSSEYSHFINL